MKIVSLQFGLFFQSEVSRPDTEFSDLSAELPVFDTIPTILPLPKEVPGEVPIVSYRSEDGSFACNIARTRIDIFRQRVESDSSNEPLLATFNQKVELFLKYVLSKQSVVRFGVIATYFLETDSAASLIKNKYLKPDVTGVDDVFLRFNRKTSSDGFVINDSVSLYTGTASIGSNSDVPGLGVQRDINSAPDGRVFTYQALKRLSSTHAQLLTEQSVKELVE